MLRLASAALLFSLSLACGKAAPAPTSPQPAASPPTCEAAVDHVIALAVASEKAKRPGEGGRTFTEAMLVASRTDAIAHCTDENWTPEHRSCFLSAKLVEDAKACAAKHRPR